MSKFHSPVGRPTGLTDEIRERVLLAIPKVIVRRQVARLSRIHPDSLRYWLETGDKDISAGRFDTALAQFTLDYYETLARVVQIGLQYIAAGHKSYGAMTWILEKCFREDFGRESDEIRDILDKFATIYPLLVNKGDTNERDEPENEHPNL